MRNQNFEVPFLAYYRKEYVEPELDINALWRVYHFDAKVSFYNNSRNYNILYINMY